MWSLAEIQAGFLEALRGDDRAPVLEAIAGDGLTPAARIAIHRHHLHTTLTDALRATYPVARRLVGDGFFAYAAHAFIRAHLPAGPCLFEYGDRFPDFLATFPACEGLPYLGDVARLEWALNGALHAEPSAPLDLETLARVDLARAGRLTFELDESLALVASPWPIDRIWRANQPDADPDAIVDLDGGGARLGVRRIGDDAIFRTLDAGAYALRHALLAGACLAAACDAAAADDPDFDVTAALQTLFEERLLRRVRLAPIEEDHR